MNFGVCVCFFFFIFIHAPHFQLFLHHSFLFIHVHSFVGMQPLLHITTILFFFFSFSFRCFSHHLDISVFGIECWHILEHLEMGSSFECSRSMSTFIILSRKLFCLQLLALNEKKNENRHPKRVSNSRI